MSFDEKTKPSWLNEPEILSTTTKRSSSSSINSSPSSSVEKKRLIERVPKEEEDNFIRDCCCCPWDPVLCGFQIFHIFVALLLSTVCAANIFFFSNIKNQIDIRDVMMRCYAIFFAFISILSELDFRVARKYVKILEWWVVRGFWYSFIGLISVDPLSSAISFANIIGIALVAVGFIYILMGLIGLRDLKKKQMAEYYGITSDLDGNPYTSV